ncbi:telomerase Cajal body protein 1 homolog [Drosophila sulfurigaster albostrigata]|uniref:telomerase Cajal body protein 1 homolog n=1 Tax=Drosophila sulfurigaster albostrigata TaxID=89887 RepID=UPI002D21E263|nr:telomerase Cajal body protein 1 homolog [Drosophila sulfurigaster albostrigata]
MEISVDLSATMSVDDINLEQETSLLNHNVSFNTSIENTLASTTIAGESMSNLSFSLSEAERHRLRQTEDKNCETVNRNTHCVLNDLSVNLEEKRPINASLSCMETNVVMEESSSTLGRESERIINIEDTLDEIPVDNRETRDSVPGWSSNEQTRSNTVPMAKQLVELGRRHWSSTIGAQRYTKGCYWSPDGTCLLIPVHTDGMHVVEMPLDLYNSKCVTPERDLSELQSAVHVPEGGAVYDCTWYPLMSSQDASTCLWIATRQHEPIHMWDAFDGSLRCSYSGYDKVDEVIAAISLSFSHDGQKIYAGYKHCIKIFDTSRPGRICDEYAVKFAVSCIAQTSEHPHALTCGNWKGYIQHFDLRCPPNEGPMFTLGGHSAGITQLSYADNAGNWQLYSGARKCPKLLEWDMRNYKAPLREFQRIVNTNQRIQFDLSIDHSWLASGDTNGDMNIWNLKSNHNTQSAKVPVHGDCCNGIGFHPILPILASTSGQYHFITGDNHEILMDSMDTNTHQRIEEEKLVIEYENSVVLLWFGDTLL